MDGQDLIYKFFESANFILQPISCVLYMIFLCFWLIMYQRFGKSLSSSSRFLVLIVFLIVSGVLIRTYKLTLDDLNVIKIVDRVGETIDFFANTFALFGTFVIFSSFKFWRIT